MRTETDSPEATAETGASLATRLSPGDSVVVSGEQGTGKTTFIRGACAALGVDGPVTSPTFTIGQIYGGRLPGGEPIEVAHLDLYRLPSLDDEDPALLEDYLTAGRIGFVEWPAIAAGAIPRVAARVVIRHLGGDRRAIEIE